jgi:hypothetical protein
VVNAAYAKAPTPEASATLNMTILDKSRFFLRLMGVLLEKSQD